MSAAHYRLDNLVVVVDRNTLQITDRTEKVMALEPLKDKFLAFGYQVSGVDGNNISDLVHTFNNLSYAGGKPNLIIAQTVKGKGISYIEDKVNWHHRVPSKDEFSLAQNELQVAEDELREKYGKV
jgi:transketolase